VLDKGTAVMLNFILMLIVCLVFMAAFLLIRTIRLHHRQSDIEPVEKPKLDKNAIARHLVETIQCKTISDEDAARQDYSAWVQLHKVLKQNYPLAHTKLEKQEINRYSLLYKWAGRDSSLKPLLFAAHQDVVPVDTVSERQWTHPPFAGEMDKEFVWGRGALDMKNHLVALMEAVEFLLQSGYSPKRTIYLAFGHDEEIYGRDGALKIAQQLEKQGVHLGAVLDEGGSINAGLLKEAASPLAVVCTSEKGFLTLDLKAAGKPGHSSAPPPQTAIAIIARAVALLADHPMPADLVPLLPLLEKLAVQLPLAWQVMIANPWLFKQILIHQLQKDRLLNAQIRTTSATTIIKGGVKDNILPAESHAKVNFRIRPGDSVETVVKHAKKVIADPRVEVDYESESGWDPTRNSPIDHPAYFTLELAIRQVFDNIPVAPAVFRGATDARHYERICQHVYRFTPLFSSSEDANRVHGINERVRIDDLEKMAAFFIRLVRLWGESEF
jgi:carboxypeptidase PM20D1